MSVPVISLMQSASWRRLPLLACLVLCVSLMWSLPASAQESGGDQVCCRGFYGENHGFMPREACTGQAGDVAPDSFCESSPIEDDEPESPQLPVFYGYEIASFPAPCVNDVESWFREGNFSYRPTFEDNPDDRVGPFDMRVPQKDDASGRFRANFLAGAPLPPQNRKVKAPASFFDHIQGAARIDVGGEPYIVAVMGLGGEFGMSSSYDHGAMYALKLGEVPGKDRAGKAIVHPKRDFPKIYLGGDKGGDNKAVSYVEFLTSTHPGGIQAQGTIVAVPLSCDNKDLCSGPSVRFYDFADPAHPKLIHEKFLQEPENNKAHWVAFARLKDDRHLMFVNRGNNGNTDVYVTKTKTPLGTSTKWEDNDSFARFNFWTPELERYGVPQNMSLLYECDDGQFYLASQGPVTKTAWRRWDDDNVVALLKITGRLSQGTAKPKFISAATFERHGDYCQMGGGSSLYITREHEPIIYCTAGWARGALKISELTALSGDYADARDSDRVDVLD